MTNTAGFTGMGAEPVGARWAKSGLHPVLRVMQVDAETASDTAPGFRLILMVGGSVVTGRVTAASTYWQRLVPERPVEGTWGATFADLAASGRAGAREEGSAAAERGHYLYLRDATVAQGSHHIDAEYWKVRFDAIDGWGFAATPDGSSV